MTDLYHPNCVENVNDGVFYVISSTSAAKFLVASPTFSMVLAEWCRSMQSDPQAA